MAKPKKAARSIADVELPPWRAVMFADLHYSARTKERGLRVLARVRETAIERDARVVFLGDFWDLRGSLPLRQLDPLLDELALWERAGIQVDWIPGNHDQVSMDGKIHGIRVFNGFRGFRVATDRVLDYANRLAFIPWREDPAEQAAMFDLPGKDWTIFAHAELEGATTNYAHRALGRVTIAKLEEHARAVYCGHYHKQQQLGQCSFYIGSPFEQNFGEMGEPKGIAFTQQGQVRPTWIPLEDFPKHHRVLHSKPYLVTSIRPGDIVEYYAPKALLGTPQIQEAIASLPTADVRPLPVKEETKEEIPSFALSLDHAIDTYVEEMASEADVSGAELLPPPLTLDDLKDFARELLKELPEAKAYTPMSPIVRVVSVEISNFCAILGNITFDLDNRGMLLLRGAIGAGKTALMDAITWGLYGATSPRKAGASSATFRGDEVIHDLAKSCSVEVTLELEDQSRVIVTREKERGKGVRASIDGFDMPDGISDQQTLINHIVGLDHSLWATCVYLGQGSVANFVTNADKARKELLSNAYGLGVCDIAQGVVKKRLKPIRAELDKLSARIAAEKRACAELERTNYEEQISSWEAQRQSSLSAARAQGEQAAKAIEECDNQLETESAWLERKREHDAYVEQLTSQLAKMTSGGSQVERSLGAVQGELGTLEAQHMKLGIEKDRLEKSYEANPSLPCPTCGSPMKNDAAEMYVRAKIVEFERCGNAIATAKAKIRNLEAELSTIKNTASDARERVEQSLADSRVKLEQIGTALSQFARLRANREAAEKRLADARALWLQHEEAENPWTTRQAERDARLAELQAEVNALLSQRDSFEAQRTVYEFWEFGFGPKGVASLVLRTALYELEAHANQFLAQLVGSRLYCELTMLNDSLGIRFYEQLYGQVQERRYEQLSGGQRRCVELAFSPFALSEVVFSRCGVRIPMLVIDELTTHLGADEKPLVIDLLRRLDRETIVVIDHDVSVQGEFDSSYELTRDDGAISHLRRAG